MSTHLQARTQARQPSAFMPVNTGVLQRKSGDRRRDFNTDYEKETVPPIVQEVLNSPGHPLDEDTRAFMESRFGHDFSNVRVHKDDRAGESAKAINALAYTIGNDVVFGSGQFEAGSKESKKLLAHELTHVVQQPESLSHSINNLLSLNYSQQEQVSCVELEADRTAQQIGKNNRVNVSLLSFPTKGAIMRKPINPELQTPEKRIHPETELTVSFRNLLQTKSFQPEEGECSFRNHLIEKYQDLVNLNPKEYKGNIYDLIPLDETSKSNIESAVKNTPDDEISNSVRWTLQVLILGYVIEKSGQMGEMDTNLMYEWHDVAFFSSSGNHTIGKLAWWAMSNINFTLMDKYIESIVGWSIKKFNDPRGSHPDKFGKYVRQFNDWSSKKIFD